MMIQVKQSQLLKMLMKIELLDVNRRSGNGPHRNRIIKTILVHTHNLLNVR